MKKSKKYLLEVLVLAVVLPFAACASDPVAATSTQYRPENPAPIEIVEPLAEYLNDTDEAFRARASAEAMSAMAAQKAAMMNAKVELAGKINTAIDSVGKSSTETAQDDAAITTQTNFRELAKAHVEQTLNNIHVLGQKTFRDPVDGRYIVYVAIEVNKKAVADTLANKASQTSPEQKEKLRAALETAFEEK
ncbi:MAG: LPP20 family lipoprotein [Opitutales bacterium]|nr:LPP20 family lipoprotein [Opitutales bacterium]